MCELLKTTEDVDMTLWPETLEYAPIVISVYMRTHLLRRTIDALKRNTLASKSALFIFSDAPGHPEHVAGIREVRDYLRTITGFKHVVVVERGKNYGPLNNTLDAIRRVLDRYDRYIGLEEDIETSPYFLEYMNDALAVFRDDPRVMAVSSHKPPFRDDPARDEVYFMHHFNPWGNAFWKKWLDAAMHYDAAELRERKLLAKFDRYSSFIIPNSRMLRMTAAGKINAVDAVVNGNILLRGGHVVYPPRSLSNHIGFGDGVHCTVRTRDFLSRLSDRQVSVAAGEVREDPVMVERYHNWLLRRHVKLLFKYLVTLGPIRNMINAKYKNREN